MESQSWFAAAREVTAMNALLVILASTVTLLAPEDGAVYDTCPPQVREFLANSAKRIENPPEKDLGGFAVHNDWS